MEEVVLVVDVVLIPFVLHDHEDEEDHDDQTSLHGDQGDLTLYQEDAPDEAQRGTC